MALRTLAISLVFVVDSFAGLPPRTTDEIEALAMRMAEGGKCARTVNITPKTLYRWQQEPEFERAYRKARKRDGNLYR